MALLALALPLHAGSAPGAHGPNGEHLDGPVTSTASPGAAPRFEARSEAFELVARLSDAELSLFINRYETNEPVNDAQVELELGGLKAIAAFHADQGDYAVADEAFLKAVSAPGEHAIVVTLSTGGEVDLLDGVLVVPAQAHGDALDHRAPRWLPFGLGALALALLAGAGGMLVRRGTRKPALGGAR